MVPKPITLYREPLNGRTADLSYTGLVEKSLVVQNWEGYMQVDYARGWIVRWSLLVTAGTFLFLVLGPALGYPLDWDQIPRLFEIILPVFLGYLGSASHFVFRGQAPAANEAIAQRNDGIDQRASLLGVIVRGPIIVFSVAIVAVAFAFGYSNRVNAAPGSGMSIDQLAASITALLGILAVTTNVAVSYLFSLGGRVGRSGMPSGENG